VTGAGAGPCSVAEFVEDARDNAALFRRLGNRWRLFAVPDCFEDLLDFVVDRKAASAGFREDDTAVEYDVELAGLAGLYLGVLIEARLE
jgi:hypothetical protein